MIKRKNKSNVFFEQESWWKGNIHSFKELNFLDCIFLNFFQLIPLWVMLLIQIVSEYRFKFIDLVNNIIVVVVVTCGTNIYNFFRKRNTTKEIQLMVLTIMSISILCISSVLYCLLLMYNLVDIRIKEDIISMVTFLLLIIVYFISLALVGIMKGKNE